MIEVRALTKVYGATCAVSTLSFTAPPGKVTGFLGPNGAGKTSTLRCVLGLAQPTSGSALIDGHPYRELVSPRRHVGAVLESPGFHPARTGRNHLRVIARAAGIDAARIDPLLELVGLCAAADRRVGGYSFGMRQRLGLAAAMLGNPEVVVLDEPANGLDPEGVSWVRRLLRIWADEGRTVVVSSHLLAEVAQVVDRVVVIRDGRLVTETDLAELTDGVTVRVDRIEPMVRALRAEGLHHEVRADGAISVTAESSAFRRAAGPVAWMVLEELARAARVDESGCLLARQDLRRISSRLGLAKDTVARAVRRLIDAGAVSFKPGRQAGGRFGRGSYVLALDGTGLAVAEPAVPCPHSRDAGNRDTVGPAPGRGPSRPHVLVTPSQLDLFEPDNATNPSIDRIDASDSDCPIPVNPKTDPENLDALAPRWPGPGCGRRERGVGSC